MNNLHLTNYDIIRLLGEGGMSFVYLARHRLLQQEVAVKVLKQEYVRMVNMKGRFLAKARSLFRMSHTNILRVTDMIDEGETVAFVMEYIEGWSLRDYLERKGMLREEEISQILVQMLEALDYVHSQGLVHRDIKPSNIMLTPGGVVKLMDFGISKRTEGAIEHTLTEILGTSMYMSPEQIKSTKDVTYVSDLYSLGVVLWEMVTGRKPYNGEAESTYQIHTRIVREDLPLTGTRWDVIIGGSTVKDEGGRYRSAKEFRAAVEKAFGYKDKTIIADQTIHTLTLTNQQLDTPMYMSPEQIKSRKDVIMEEPTGTTIKIGNQEWMTRNLDVDRFRNGDLIPQAQSAEAWEEAGHIQQPAWCYYGNNPENGKIYGKLYNWYVVNDPRGLAPKGWHIPTFKEWSVLRSNVAESINWIDYISAGFNAPLSGWRVRGSFYHLGDGTYFWSFDYSSDFRKNFSIIDYYDTIVLPSGPSDGVSVRCLRDDFLYNIQHLKLFLRT